MTMLCIDYGWEEVGVMSVLFCHSRIYAKVPLRRLKLKMDLIDLSNPLVVPDTCCPNLILLLRPDIKKCQGFLFSKSEYLRHNLFIFANNDFYN